MVNGQRIECSINKPIGELLPCSPLTSFGFRSLYDLARVISVITSSHVPENFRLARMLDSSYDVLTPSCLGLAISFFRAHCIHATIASVEDAGKPIGGFPPRTRTDPYHLPRMFATASKYADDHPWTTTSWSLIKPRRNLLLLPKGFEEVTMCFESSLMTAKVVSMPEDIVPEWFEEEYSAVIMFTIVDYAEPLRWKGALFHLLNAVARGAELIAFAGPQDSSDWGKTVDLMRDFMEEIVVQRPSLAQRIRCLLPMKSQQMMIDAPFKILADKINLQTGRHFTQSAAKRFWTAVLAQHKAILKLPEFKRSHQNERKTETRQMKSYRGRGARPEVVNRSRSGPLDTYKPRSLSRLRQHFCQEARQEFSRRSCGGKHRRGSYF
ncbi:hypothetical protein Q1695_011672 [Nippostrongylus brasiliensis]|nr:hypothetical protein Q1695_011672 [Nippostrongylus brasiliensis]